MRSNSTFDPSKARNTPSTVPALASTSSGRVPQTMPVPAWSPLADSLSVPAWHAFLCGSDRQGERGQGKTAPQTLKDAMAMGDPKAQFDGPTAAVGSRLMKQEGALYLDLCDEKWGLASQSTEEKIQIWSLFSPSPNPFTRCSTLFSTSNSFFVRNLPQPLPAEPVKYCTNA